MTKPASSLLALTALALLVLTGTAGASDDRRIVRVNYVFAAQLGIGGYSIAGLTADVFTLPLSYTFDLEEREGWRLKLQAAISLGLYRLDLTDEDGTHIQIDQQTLALMPGAELQIPVSEQWTLKPFLEIGAARLLEPDSPYALIYSAGIRSLYRLPLRDFTLTIGNGALYAGNGTSDEDQEAYSAIENGIEIRRPLGLRLGEMAPDLGLFAIAYYYPKPLHFDRFLQDPLEVQTQLELGFSLGSAEPFAVLGIQNPRVGAGYIFGDGLTVFRINFGFPF